MKSTLLQRPGARGIRGELRGETWLASPPNRREEGGELVGELEEAFADGFLDPFGLEGGDSSNETRRIAL